MAPSDKTQYDKFAVEYNSQDYLPAARIEAQLIRKALGDCNGLRILDLGGGSGIHARQAIEAGAQQVDVVDISDAMMNVGKGIEAQSSREERIRWHTADASRPLAEQATDLLPPGQYDLTMANWLFDHAHTIEELKGMWENIAASLRPGGKFLGIRAASPGMLAQYVKEGKYGYKYDSIEKIPGGVKTKVVFLGEPPFSFDGTTMEDSCNMTNEIPRQLGFVDFETVPAEDMEIISEDPEFWKPFLDEPCFLVVTARKI